LPLDLKWSYVGVPVLPRIAAGVEKHVDLFHIPDPRVSQYGSIITTIPPTSPQAILQLEVRPNVNPGVLEAGDYNLTLVVTASNFEARSFQFFFTVPDTWIANDSDMTKRVRGRGLATTSTIMSR
jgi:hypothetical protein